MNKPLASFLILISLFLLSGCQTAPEVAQLEPLTPLPAGPIDPTDAQLKDSVIAFLNETGAPLSSLYEYRRVDLNKDGRRDALVIFKNPYGYWCDLHGCTMLVMEANDDKFTLVNAIQPVREPLYVSDLETNGWKNLIIRVTGRWDESKDVAMTYDEGRYPDNPASLPAYMRFAENTDHRLFY